MRDHHGGESTGEPAGALASVRGGDATVEPGASAGGAAALSIRRDDQPLLEVPFGTVHAVVGPVAALRELVSRLSGTPADRRRATAATGAATVLVAGRPARLSSRASSNASGIAVVTTGQAVSWSQTVGENVLLGSERPRGLRETLDRLLGGAPGHRDQAHPAGRSDDAGRVRHALDVVGLDRSPEDAARTLSVIERRLVELARAVAGEASLVVVDDAGAGLGVDDAARWRRALVEVARAPRSTASAPGVLLATGTVTDLAGVASAATVLAADGAPSAPIRLDTASAEREVLAALVGEPPAEEHSGASGSGSSTPRPATPPRDRPTGVGLVVDHWTASHPADPERTVVDDLSFACAPGEVLGLFGPPDSGAGEVLLSVFGRSYGARTRGSVSVDGTVVDVSTTDLARTAGVLYTTEHPIRFDLSFLGGVPSSVSPVSLTRMVSLGVADPRRDYRATTAPGGLISAVPGAHRGPDAAQFTESLRVLADTDARVVLLAEPFGAAGTADSAEARRRTERSDLVRTLAASGRAVVVSSDDPAALAAVCDRVLAIRAGRIVGCIGGSDTGRTARIDTRAVIDAMGGLA